MRTMAAGVLAATLIAAGAGQGAMAADYGVAPARSGWTSCYAGGNAGAAWEQTTVVDELDPSIFIASLSATALAGGGQIGCDYQFANNWVVGIQGMWDATGLDASTTGGLLGPLTLHGHIPWVATATVRLGYAPSPNLLLYAKGGGAWNHTDTNLYVTADGTPVDAASFNQSGWTAGGGAEWKLGKNMSVFAEYDYLGFSPQVVSYPNSNNLGSVTQNVQLALIGINFRLGAP